jgi:CshA-type fibril repeat protein
MKKLYITIFLIVVAFQLKAQTYINSWITPRAVYAKIAVSKTGIYEITGQEIAAKFPSIIGVPVSSLSLIFQGKPVSIEIIAAGTTFQVTDKIRFYGIENNGELETELYRPVTDQPHKLKSLYSKESVYFLSSGTNPNKFITNETEVTSSTIITQVTGKTIIPYASDYTFNSAVGPIPIIQNSFFEKGEGPSGPIIRANTATVFKIPLKNISSSAARLELLINGRDVNNRIVRTQIANKDTLSNLFGFFASTIKLNLTLSLPLPQDTLPFTISANEERFSVSVINLIHTKTLSSDLSNSNFYLPANANVGNVNMSKVGIGIPEVYNVTDVFNVKKVKLAINTTNALQYTTDPAVKTKENIYYINSLPLKPDSIGIFSFSSNLSPLANYIIISSKKLKASAEKYKDFRTSAEGGGHLVELVYMEDLYNEFNYGIKSPLAIKNFMRLKLAAPSAVKNLLLLGKAFSLYTGINSSTDLVPSLGYPASDLLLSSGIVTPIDVFGVATGRIPAVNDVEVEDYLQKVKEHIARVPSLIQKNVFHFNGGKTLGEIGNFGAIMDNLGAIATSSDFAVNFTSKRKTDPSATAQPANLSPEVNQGQSLMGYFGHSSYTSLDFNIGYATNAALGFNNTKHPVFYFSGCAFNNYFRDINTLSKDWIFAKNKGAVAIIGQSYLGYESSLTKHGILFYETIFKSTEEPTIGEALKITSQKVANKLGFSSIDVLNNDQTLLFGDPAIKIFNYDKPDYSIDQTSFKQSISGNNRTVKFKVINNGKTSPDTIRIRVIEEGLPTNIIKEIKVAKITSTDSFSIVLNNIALLNKIKIEIDPQNSISEITKSNNTFVFLETLGTNASKASDDLTQPLPSGSLGSINILQNDKLFDNSVATTTNTTVDLNPLTPEIETSLLKTGQGTWSYLNGTITFTPVSNFTKDPTPLIYLLVDNATQGKSTATVSVDYRPVAVNNTDKFAGGTTKTFDVIQNDLLGDSVLANTATLVGTTGPGQSLVVSGQGTWKINNLGTITFIPEVGFFTDPTPIKYTVKDLQGNVSNEASVILDALPLAKNDIIGYTKGDLVSINVLINDNLGDVVDISTLRFSGNPNGSQTEGLWSIAGSFITFTPSNPNALIPPIISYQIADFQGNISTATIELDANPPIANNDQISFQSGQIHTLNLFANDTSGDTPVEAFLSDPDPNSNGKRKTVPNQGLWEMMTNNTIKFTPLSTFGGSPSTIKYYSIDAQGSASNEATITFATVLPIELSQFKVIAKEDYNLISWKAQSEKGFSHFELLKSKDLIEFYDLQKVNTNESKNYSFQDKENIVGVTYYQIKMVDIDGKIQYSKILSVIQESKASNWIVYPNPIKGGKVSINYTKQINEVKLYDMTGKLISNNLKFDKDTIYLIENCTSGEYLLSLNTEEGTLSKRITITN